MLCFQFPKGFFYRQTMKDKDAYYFPHYSNARNDQKIMKLRRVLGMEGYGIFFCLLEILRDQTNFKLPLGSLPELEFEFRVSKEKILSVINDYDLFTIDENNFFSPKLVLYLQPYIEKSQRARNAALVRWNKIKENENNANALPEYNKCNANADAKRGEESKVKEKKVKKDSSSPTIFYENEIKENKEHSEIKIYEMFTQILFGENEYEDRLTNVLKMPQQVTYKQFLKLYE